MPLTSSTFPLIQHNTTSANHERIVSSNGAAYASVTINNNNTVPVNPPTGVQPVMYSKVAGDIIKVFISLYFFIINMYYFREELSLFILVMNCKFIYCVHLIFYRPKHPISAISETN